MSKRLSDHLSERTTSRIKNGTFKPKPDNKAATRKLRAGGRRKDQPFVTGIKVERAKGVVTL